MGRHSLSSSCPQSASQRLAYYLVVYTFVPPRVIWGGLEEARNGLDTSPVLFLWLFLDPYQISHHVSFCTLDFFFFLGCAGTSLGCMVFSLVVACRLSCYATYGLLVPRPGIEPCIGRWTLHYWTTREVPPLLSMQEKLLQCSKVSISDSHYFGISV